MSKAKPDLFQEEAKRLAQLPARQRKEALAVHWRIAEDARLAHATRNHAAIVAQTLEALIDRILAKKRKK